MEQNNNNDIIVNKSELEQIEKEILAKDKQKEDAFKINLEKEIRSKLEQEQRLKELEERNKKLEELITFNTKKQEEDRLQREQELQKIKEELAKPKGFVNTNNPFHNNIQEPKFNANNLTKEQVGSIEEESKKAFMKHLGMADVEWQIDREKK
jgi:hypothetical protein